MGEHEMRVVNGANSIVIHHLITEIAAMKGEKGPAWIDTLRDSIVTELKAAESFRENAESGILATIRNLVEGQVATAKLRLEERQTRAAS